MVRIIRNVTSLLPPYTNRVENDTWKNADKSDEVMLSSLLTLQIMVDKENQENLNGKVKFVSGHIVMFATNKHRPEYLYSTLWMVWRLPHISLKGWE